MIRGSLTLLLCCLWLSPSATARDLFVNNVTGDDTRDGSSPGVSGTSGGPCRTIGRALQLTRASDRLHLAKTDQPYRESITLQAARHSGTPQQPFELIGNGAILDGVRPVPAGGWEHVRGNVYRFHPALTSFQVLYLGDKPATRRPSPASAGPPPLEPLEWCLYDRHIYFSAETKKLPTVYPLSYAHLTVGITLYEARHIVIRDLIIQGFQLDGVSAHDGVMDGTLERLICRGNGRSGISIGGACRLKIRNCLAGDNGAAQMRTEGRCKAEIQNCQLLDNTAPGLVREGGEVLVADAGP